MVEKYANDFVTKLEAHGSDNDCYDLGRALDEYKSLLTKLPSEDRPSFSLNVFCVLCRNLDKVPSWKQKIYKDLLNLAIECVRQTQGSTGDTQVKTLAAIYHVHKNVTMQSLSIPPELVLKLSIIPFECDTPYLISQYHKTYWSIVADRINYIERLKRETKIPIVKLLPKLNEDLSKIVQIYIDKYDFCSNILPFIVKKITFIYADITSLYDTYRIIFETLKDYESDFKELNDKQSHEIYTQFNECIYVIADNSSKNSFKNSPLDDIVRICLQLLGHKADIFHCLQTFYMNSFLYIFTRQTDTENVFKNILLNCEMTEKLGYKELMYITYPYINHLLRLCIKFFVNKKISDQLGENCLNLILFLMKKVSKCRQIVKCEKCSLQSGLHDSLGLSFVVKSLFNKATSEKLKYLPQIIENQYQILQYLKNKCIKHEKYYTKLQTDVHNLAIQFYKEQNYEISITLFNLYIKNELHNKLIGKDLCRALYNKSICELDTKNYGVALNDAFLSMIFDEGQNSEQYMSLVLEIKWKAIQADEGHLKLQLMSVLEAANGIDMYGDIKEFLKDKCYSALLLQEYSIYERLWPSLVPITGVLNTLYDMIEDKYDWIKAENQTNLKKMLYDLTLTCPKVVRNIQEVHFKEIIKKIIDDLTYDELSPDDKLMYISLLVIKSDQDIQDASDKYEWRPKENYYNPDESPIYKKMSHEFEATKESIRAVELLATLDIDLETVCHTRLSQLVSLSVLCMYQLLHMERIHHALQLAHCGTKMADVVSDSDSYVRFAGTLLYYDTTLSPIIYEVSVRAVNLCHGLLSDRRTVEAALVFICELGMYYTRCNKQHIAAMLLNKAETCALEAYKTYPDIKLDLALGRIMELETLLSEDMCLLSAVNIIQRHYIMLQAYATTWLPRRTCSLHLRSLISPASVYCTRVCRALMLWRRASTAAGAALRPVCAAVCGRLFAYTCDTSRSEEARVKIDKRLKHIIGLTNEIKHKSIENKITPTKTPKYNMLEVSLNTMQTGRTSPIDYFYIPNFEIPEFLTHPKCSCYACNMPACAILACMTSSLEASLYFRSKQNKIAKNYFSGASTTFKLAKIKLHTLFDKNQSIFEDFVLDIVKKQYTDELNNVEIEFLIEYAFFELSENNFDGANEHAARIIDLSEKSNDLYIKNEIRNLLIAMHWLSKPKTTVEVKNLEIEFDNMKLTECPKTPETKNPPKMDAPKLVHPEELPKKKVDKEVFKKINFTEEEQETPQKPKPKVKIPVPVISKPNVESITPRPIRKPKITLTEPDTPEFFTPKSTPNEKFFTPIPKTSSRKIVKNLESEFSTPTEPKSLRKKTLLQASTSGASSVTRSRRLKQPDFSEN